MILFISYERYHIQFYYYRQKKRRSEMQKLFVLVVIVFMCQSCWAEKQKDQEELQVIEEFKEKTPTGVMVSNIMEEGRQAREEGFEVPEEVLVIIRGLEQQYGLVQLQQKQNRLEAEVLKGKLNRITEASLAELRIVLAGNGVTRKNMGKWHLVGNKILYKP